MMHQLEEQRSVSNGKMNVTERVMPLVLTLKSMGLCTEHQWQWMMQPIGGGGIRGSVRGDTSETIVEEDDYGFGEVRNM